MKIKILYILSMISFAGAIIIPLTLLGCGNGINVNGHQYLVKEFDGCEYIILDEYTDYQSFSHKGNCRNTIHLMNRK
jgi:hypothetical protein